VPPIHLRSFPRKASPSGRIGRRVPPSALLEKGIYFSGRFGAWRYEIGKRDDSVLTGVERVKNILAGENERVFHGS
jgi:hypothetical protein